MHRRYASKTTRRRIASRPQEPFVGRACPRCGSASVVAPCACCGRWFVVCDCTDEDVAVDRYVSTDGRCPICRDGGDGAA